MTCKYIAGFIILLLCLEVVQNAPAFKFDFLNISKTRNCTFPPSINVPNVEVDEKFYLERLKSCSSNDLGKMVQRLCHQIDILFTPLLCSRNIDASKINVTVPYPEGTEVCSGFGKLKDTPYGDNNMFCEMVCDNALELCNFLLWVKQINHEMLDKVPPDNGIDQAPSHVQDIQSVTTVAMSISTHQAKGLATTDALGTSNNSTVQILSIHSSIGQPVSTHNSTSNKDAVVSVSSGIASSAMYTVSHQVNNGKTAKFDENTVKTSILKVTEGAKLHNNSEDDKAHVKETKLYSLPVSPDLQSNELTSFNSFNSEIGETVNNGIDPSVEEDIQDYSTVIASKTSAGLTEIMSSEQFPGSEPQTKTNTIGKDNSRGPGFLIGSIHSLDKNISLDLMENEDSHFFLYFLFIVGIVVGCYILFHNKQKIIALIVEGRHERRRRPNGASYKKLETK